MYMETNTIKKIAKAVDDENEKNFNILRRRLSETTRENNRITRQNLSLQKDIKSIKKEIEKIRKLATCGFDYSQEITEICDKILK